MPTADRRVVRLRVVWGVATALGFCSGFQAFFFISTITQKPASFGLLLALNLGYWYSWALLAPGVIWLSRRYPLERHRWAVSIPVHVMGVFVTTLLHVALAVTSRLVINLVFGETGSPWRTEFQRMFFLNFDWEMMTYWAIIGLSHALVYHREAQARALGASQLETRLVEARLQSLQRQLQPHFLFNTLHTISALMHRDVEAADAMIARLSDLLRMSLDMVGVQEVALKQELDFLSKYLEIEQTRFRDRLTIVLDIQPDTLDVLVPNLLLQPLVENAIKHGIGSRPSAGRVTIRSRLVDDRLELQVQDDGAGLSASRLSAFNGGVGLSNTRSRLDHLYGSAHRFEFIQPAEGGLLVRIAIPVEEMTEWASADEAVEGAA